MRHYWRDIVLMWKGPLSEGCRGNQVAAASQTWMKTSHVKHVIYWHPLGIHHHVVQHNTQKSVLQMDLAQRTCQPPAGLFAGMHHQFVDLTVKCTFVLIYYLYILVYWWHENWTCVITGESETLGSIKGSKCKQKCIEHNVHRALSQSDSLNLITWTVLQGLEFRFFLYKFHQMIAAMDSRKFVMCTWPHQLVVI
jgi:hypothetical protein